MGESECGSKALDLSGREQNCVCARAPEDARDMVACAFGAVSNVMAAAKMTYRAR